MNESNSLKMGDKSLCRCPQCVDSIIEDLGELPDCYKFMGKDVNRMLGGRLYICKNCQLRFRYPVPTQEKLNNLYDQADINNWDGGSSLERLDFSLVTKFILNKIEKVKELLVYDEITLSEIAFRMHYSSVAHLSNQFKKLTGLTPSHFKNLKRKRHSILENGS